MNTRLKMTGIRKSFGPTVALRGVDLELRAGEVHALIGENGAGKSTLMKVLSGAVTPDAGQMSLDGQPFAPADPKDARRRGVVMIYQELTLAPDLSVEANILLGTEDSQFGFLSRDRNRRRVADALRLLEHPEIHPDAAVFDLGPGAQQLVEIARALILDVNVLVLDEPTSALSREDVERLFQFIRRLRERGVSIVYISHFLEEVEAIADRYTVLRDGQSVATGEAASFSRNQVIGQMVGRPLAEQFPRVPHAIGEPVLQIRDLVGKKLPRGVTLTLHRGEILGIAGILGAGRTETLRAVFSLDPLVGGQIIVKGQAPRRASVRTRMSEGCGFLCEDRKAEGLSLSQSIADNLTYSRLSPYARWFLLDLRRRSEAVVDWLRKLNVRFAHIGQPVENLSGGNQQKVALGRLLHQEADILLLDEPTKGVDVGSKSEIYRLIGELAAQGKAILLVSSYLPELFGVCDRLAVMARGRLSEVRSIERWTPAEVMSVSTSTGG
jgi:ribose transport system ATP-binding protein